MIETGRKKEKERERETTTNKYIVQFTVFGNLRPLVSLMYQSVRLVHTYNNNNKKSHIHTSVYYFIFGKT